MEWRDNVGYVGKLFLCGYLIVVGVAALIGGIAIPAWAIGCVAVAAGVLLLVGK